MLELYHGGSSVCSAKVRVGLAEKGLMEWTSHPISLPKGEQFNKEYLSINPKGVVPVLIHDGFKIFESSIILEYLDELSSKNMLMPTDSKEQVTAKLWLLRCIEIHGAVNTMTFSTVGREKILATKSKQEIAQSVAKIPNPWARGKRFDLFEHGLKSDHVTSDFHVLKKLFEDMNTTLEQSDWMNGSYCGITDVAIIAYIDRLDRLGMSGLWEGDYPHIARWLAAMQQRPSYEVGINAYTSTEDADKMRSVGATLWPDVKKRWEIFKSKTV